VQRVVTKRLRETFKKAINMLMVITMRKSWKGKNVDLALLVTRIGDFFKVKDFEAVKGQTSTGYQIFAEDSPHFKIDGYINVTVEGSPDNFTVNFEQSTGKKKRSHIRSIFLESMFLGGYFILKRLKSEEALFKLEKEFWRHVENVVLQLSNSGKTSIHSLE